MLTKDISRLMKNTAGQKRNTKQLVLRLSLYWESAERRLAFCAERRLAFCAERRLAVCAERRLAFCAERRLAVCEERRFEVFRRL